MNTHGSTRCLWTSVLDANVSNMLQSDPLDAKLLFLVPRKNLKGQSNMYIHIIFNFTES